MKKRLLSILLTLCIALSLLPVASFATQTQIKVGDYLQFGQFEGKPIVWQVIYQEGDILLLFSSEVLFWREYNASLTEPDNYSLTKNGEEETELSEDSHHCSANRFDDVDLSKWYHEGIDYAVITGMMNGVGDNKFNPDGTTTRGMVVTIFHRIEGEPSAKKAAFTDVQSDSWYANAVNWASANGIVTGTSSSSFAPNAPVTREQLATILYRYSQFKKYETASKADLSSFRDYASIGGYAKDGLGWAVNAGLINGVGDNLLSPTGSATRAQVATILMRFSEGVARGQ